MTCMNQDVHSDFADKRQVALRDVELVSNASAGSTDAFAELNAFTRGSSTVRS